MKHQKLIAGLLALSCCAAPFIQVYNAKDPAVLTVSAAEVTSGDYKYSENGDGTLTLTKYLGSDTELQIPSEIDGKTVTAIGINAFYGAALRSVVMPDTITTVADGTFCSCNELESITISKNLTAISSNMLSACPKLNNVEVPDSVRSIGDSAFAGDEALSEIRLPATMDAIGSSAFNGCAFSSFSIPDGITRINVGTFNNCKSLSEITIPDSVRFIALNTFSNTALPADANGVIYADKWLISYTGDLEELTVREGTVGLAQESLLYKTFKKVVLPEGLKYINTQALADNYNLESVNFPDSIAVMDGAALGQKGFSAASKLMESEDEFFIVDGWLLSCNLPEDVTEITVPDGVKGIYSAAFYGRKISKITLPEGLLYIGDHAFQYSTMSSVTIPDSVKHIGAGAFMYSNDLQEVKLSENLEEIPDSAFSNCSKLQTINMPEKIAFIGEEAFVDCTSLPEIVIPDSVTKIGQKSFWGCRSAKSVQISKNLKTIPKNAFGTCGFDVAVVPEGVETVEQGAFYSANVMYLSLPSTLKFYGASDYIGSGTNNGETPDIIIFRNPETVITDHVDAISKSFRIYGVKDSTAEAYAAKYNRTFLPLSEAPAAPMAGDVNCDGKISIADPVMLARMAAEDTSVELKAFSTRNADMDGSGKIGSDDTEILLKMVAAYDFPDQIDTIVPAAEPAPVTVLPAVTTVATTETTVQADYTGNYQPDTSYIEDGTSVPTNWDRTAPAEGTVRYDLIVRGKGNGFSNMSNWAAAKPGETIIVDWVVSNDPGTASIGMNLNFGGLTVSERTTGDAYNMPVEWSAESGGFISSGFDTIPEDGAVISSFTITLPEEEGMYDFGLHYDRENNVYSSADLTQKLPFEFYGLTLIVSNSPVALETVPLTWGTAQTTTTTTATTATTAIMT